jgi:hypothetical protein
MERIYKAIDNNPEALFFKIVDAKGTRRANSSADDSEELKEAIETALDYLSDGTYTIYLGKSNNLSPQRAAVSVEYKKGNTTPLTPQKMSGNIGFISLEEAEKREQKAFDAGKREAVILDHENRITRNETDIRRIIDKMNELIKAVDSMDGDEDGTIGEKAVEVIQQFSAAKEALSGFSL